MNVYDKVVRCLRANPLGRMLVAAVWPIKRRIEFALTWVVLGRRRKIEMRQDAAYRQGLLDLVGGLPKRQKGLVMVEIGSYRGESAELFLSTGRVARIYCVDPWRPFYDRTDAASYTDMKKVELDFDNRFKAENRVIKVKGTIDDFVRNHGDVLEKQQIDFVYVDGCHTKEATEHDISVTLEKIKPNIAIAGHDYIGFSGVKEAVDECFGAPDSVFSDTSWLKVF